MKKVSILYHPMKEAAQTLARNVAGLLDRRGVSSVVCSAFEWEQVKAQITGTDWVITIGGDGTILRAAQAVVEQPIPITGINLGKLGFMTELSVDEAMAQLPALLAGKGWLDERHLLEAELTLPGEKAVRKFYALNDVVVARGAVARMIHVKATIDGETLATYRADGVILATATGSTGYALATGGPILHPQAEEFLLAPVLPHLSLAYPLVLPSATTVGLHLTTLHPATLSIDGHINLPLPDGAIITIKHSTSIIQFLRVHRESFYGSLERRLRGKIE
ncbi:MAG: NAD(+)/NADH kinase [Chloroflexota bacterium]